ncbi:MAG: phage tail tape measure protein [Cellulosilyticaceae bacterium]
MDALRSVYYDVEFKADDNPLEKADKTVDDLTESLEKMGKTGEKAGKKVEDSFDDANDEVEKLGKTAKGTTDTLGGIGSGMKGVASGIKGIVAAIGIKEITQGAYELSRGFANVEYTAAKINTLAKQDLPMVLDDMRSLAVEYGITDANIVGEAMYQALSAGRSYEDLTSGFMEGVLKTSKAGFVDPLGAVDLTTTIMNTFDVDDANEIGDVLLATQNKGKTTVNEMSQYYSRHLASFNAIGVGYKDAFGLLAEATKIVSTADASTGIGAILGEFSRSDSTVNDYFKELNGDTIPEFLSKGGSITDVIRDIKKTLDVTAMPAADMFGSLEASRTFDALTTSLESLAESISYVGESTGELEGAFKTMNETTKSELDKMQATIENSKISIGEALTPAVTESTAKIADVISFLTSGDTSMSNTKAWMESTGFDKNKHGTYEEFKTKKKFVDMEGDNLLNPEYYAAGKNESNIGEIASESKRKSAKKDMEFTLGYAIELADKDTLKAYKDQVSKQQEEYEEKYKNASGYERFEVEAILDMNKTMLDMLTKNESIINPMDFMSISDRVALADQLNEINNSTAQTFTTNVTNHINVSPAERHMANEIAREIEKSTIAYIPKASNKYDSVMMAK